MRDYNLSVNQRRARYKEIASMPSPAIMSKYEARFPKLVVGEDDRLDVTPTDLVASGIKAARLHAAMQK